VAGKVTKGAAWMISSQAIDTLVGTVATIVLSRLLVPADFGLTSLALTLVAVLALLRSFSFDLVLIQRQDATRRDYDTAWTFSLLFSAVHRAAAPHRREALRVVYDDPRLVPVVMFIALTNVLEGFQNIGIVGLPQGPPVRARVHLRRTAPGRKLPHHRGPRRPLPQLLVARHRDRPGPGAL
jgi:PST family polysaccharide transporter